MARKRTMAIFSAGALAGAAVAAALAALLVGECAGGPTGSPGDAGAGAPRDPEDGDGGIAGELAHPREPSDRGVGGPCLYSGTVADRDGEPVAGALVGVRALDVVWNEADLAAEARTDTAGAFALPGLAEGIPFQVWAWAPGMAVADVERPACGARIDFVLEPGARLIIGARSGDGEPPGALAVQIAGDPLWPPRVTVTDGRGMTEVDGLPAGTYAVWAGGHGLAAMTGEPVTLEAGDVRTVELALERARAVEVRVADEGSGEPIPGVTVFARPRDAALLALVGLTDGRGTARFPHLAPGAHELEALGPGYLRGDPTPAADGAVTTVRLRRGARVTGRVVLRDGTPVAEARLEVEEELGQSRVAWAGGGQRGILGRIVAARRLGLPPVRPFDGGTLIGPALIPLPVDLPVAKAREWAGVDDSWRADGDGRFSLAGLPPGGVVVSAFHPDLVIDTPARLTLEPGGSVDGVQVVMREGAGLRVRALGGNGYPLAGVRVAIFGPDDAALAAAITGKDGFADLAGLPGSLRVEAALEGHVPAVARVEVRPGQGGEIELTLPRADGILRGRLTDPRGFGVGEAVITARALTRGLAHVLQGTSAPDGTFGLEGAGPGDYHVTAEVDGRAVARYPAARAGVEIKLLIDESGAGLPQDTGPELVTPGMVAEAQGPDVPLVEPGDGSDEGLGVIALTETLESGSRGSEYGYVDQLPVTGPVPGKGGLPVEIGGAPGNVVVKSVAPGSHVSGAGLRAGDRIVAVDGRKVQTPAQAKAAIGGPIGSVVVIEVLQGGESVSVVVQRVRVR